MNANQFTEKSLEVLQAAEQSAALRKNAAVEQLHLLEALIHQQNGFIPGILEKMGVQNLQGDCKQAMEQLPWGSCIAVMI